MIKKICIFFCLNIVSSICAKNPCLNNGVCLQNDLGSYCKCAVNFYGTNCSICTMKFCLFVCCALIENKYKFTSSNLCSSNPCLNNGTCNQYQSANYYCQCPVNYNGQNCGNSELNFQKVIKTIISI